MYRTVSDVAPPGSFEFPRAGDKVRIQGSRDMQIRVIIEKRSGEISDRGWWDQVNAREEVAYEVRSVVQVQQSKE